MAICSPDACLTYAELEILASQFASDLQSRLRMGRGERMAMLLGNEVGWTVAFLGAALADVVAVPIDPRLYAEERQRILEHSGAIVAVDDDGAERIVPSGASTREGEVHEDDVAAIFYTSGSTGRAKGVMLTHSNVIHGAMNAQRCVALDHDSRNLIVAPLTHVVGSIAQLVATLGVGGRVDVLPSFDSLTTLRWIEEHQITVFVGVPTMYRRLLDDPAFPDIDLSTLRHCAYGGSPCPTDLVAALRRALPHVRLGNGFGLTETSSVATFLSEEFADEKPASVGLPCPVIDTRIVDSELCDVAPGHIGELLVAGPTVFAGYWNDPEETNRALSDGWLHTGDLARMDEEGFLYIVDRAKDMIIRGGDNIYCIEVEDVLQAHPAVAEAALIGMPDAVLGEQGKAVVVLRAGHRTTPEELQHFCRQHLARYKVPKQVEMLDRPLPRNHAGKVAKHQLRQRVR
jgi:long-chain acyl-CoA synthetase